MTMYEVEVTTQPFKRNYARSTDRLLFGINLFLLVYSLLSFFYLHSYFEVTAFLLLGCISLTLLRVISLRRSILITLYLSHTIVFLVVDVSLTQMVSETGELRANQLKAIERSNSLIPTE